MHFFILNKINFKIEEIFTKIEIQRIYFKNQTYLLNKEINENISLTTTLEDSLKQEEIQKIEEKNTNSKLNSKNKKPN
ncbi:MAG: hypothetical protein ACQKHC_00655 [Candidatus Phytoplasma pruni]